MKPTYPIENIFSFVIKETPNFAIFTKTSARYELLDLTIARGVETRGDSEAGSACAYSLRKKNWFLCNVLEKDMLQSLIAKKIVQAFTVP